MSRAVVTVATGSYRNGMNRLTDRLQALGEIHITFDDLPEGSPAHNDIPYAFKPAAMELAAAEGFDMLMWADACIYPVSDLDPIWYEAEKHGAWISRNGWMNNQWTADAAYKTLFPGEHIDTARILNSRIPHVVATAFAVSLRHASGMALLDEYVRLGMETRAFCGPWKNGPGVGRQSPCGGPEVLGHRHDQTALSVLAYRHSIPLTDPPEFFAYGTADGVHEPNTILVADGGY